MASGADASLLATAEAALAVARRRAAVLERMAAALDAGDTDEVVRCARLLTGREEGEVAQAASRRARARLDGVAGQR